MVRASQPDRVELQSLGTDDFRRRDRPVHDNRPTTGRSWWLRRLRDQRGL